MREKKGLAIIYDPHNLYQFIWYYCNQGKIKSWDALCLPNGGNGEYMHTFCEKSDIFENIYCSNDDFSSMVIKDKIKIFLSMIRNFAIGKKKYYCKKMLSEYVNLKVYDEITVIADVGMLSGACVALGQEKKVVIFEDGINDFGNRPRMIPKRKIFSTYSWQGFLLSKMGYCSPGWFYFSADKFCIKYSSHPEKMKYRGYKEIRQLYEKKGTDEELFHNILSRVYPMLKSYNFREAEAILVTRPLDDYVSDIGVYQKRLESYISKNYKSIILKKHPRENTNYNFEENVCVQEIDKSIPVEALLPYFKGKEIIMVTTSAVMLYLKAYDLKCKLINFEGLYEESIRTNSPFKPLVENEMKNFADEFAYDSYKIIKL